jgi:hypothetical protein
MGGSIGAKNRPGVEKVLRIEQRRVGVLVDEAQGLCACATWELG